MIYLVCFDLSATPLEQRNQINYWLQFLNSSISTSSNSNKTWHVMLVGVKADLQQGDSFTAENIQSWQTQMPNLPLYHENLFQVSSLNSISSVLELLKSIEKICSQIFEQHAMLIPSSFHKLLKSINNLSSSHVLPSSPSTEATHQTHSDLAPNTLLVDFKELHKQLREENDMELPSFKYALHYLHAIGYIVFLKNGLVCTSPTLIPKLLAKFISPSEVQKKLLSRNPEVQILNQQQIGCILQISNNQDSRYYTTPSCFLLSFSLY